MPASKPDPWGLCGTTIDGKYRVVAVVGEGGFGVVYRGVHEGFDAPIAVKCLKLPPHFDLAAQEELVKKLREEGRLLLRLSQRTPGIVQALDVGSVTAPSGARVPYLILEWLEGRTLSDELRVRRARGKGSMTLAEAAALLRPAAQALAVAHAEKIAHRDIKPENLFLVDQGDERGGPSQTLKVLDFGIAKILGDAPSPAEVSTSANPATFTPAYGAPEQFDKKRGASGPWTDVFALALVFVELVTGARALQGDELLDLYRAVTDPAVRPTIRARGAWASDAVERVLEKALHVEPRARYSDAGAFWEALTRALDSSADTAPVAAPQGEVSDASVPTAEFVSVEGIPLGGATQPDIEAAQSNAKAEKSRAGDIARGDGAGPAEPRALNEEREETSGSTLPSAAASGENAPTTRSGVVAPTTAPSPPAPSRARSAIMAACVLGFAGLVAAGLRTYWSPTAPTGAPEPASSASASSLAAAPPTSKNPQAAALYAEAVEAWRGGAPDDAVYAMEQATSLDRELSAGHLRLALWKFNVKPIDAREHYDLALRHRAGLGEKDQGLLHAVEPMLRDPWDLEQLEARMEALTRKYPDDVELWVQLGAVRHKRLRYDAAIEAFDRASALHQGIVPAWVLKAECLSMKGDPEGQLKAYNVCVANAPRAIECQVKKTSLHGRLGDCPGMLEAAKRLLSMNPKSWITQSHLAMALQATGAPRESVVEAMSRGWSFRPDTERKLTELRDRAALAVLDGDFEASSKLIQEWQVEIAGRPDQDRHASPALDLARVYYEMGATKKADEVAADFLRRMGAWTEPSLTDWTIAFLPYRWRAGSISTADFERGAAAWEASFRKKWVGAGRQLDSDLDWMIWSNRYGSFVETEAEARDAIAKMPAVIAPVMAAGRWLPVDLNVGRALALAGEVERSRPHLERVARSCSALADPMVFMQGQLYYGMALEKAGDAQRAREAYEAILARWGKARPKSLTANKARERLKALGEPKRTQESPNTLP